MSEGERRLATIMSTDIVGYACTLPEERSSRYGLARRISKTLRPVFPNHEGREVKTMGDAFLVEFASALDVVRCAFEIQQAIHKQNSVS